MLERNRILLVLIASILLLSGCGSEEVASQLDQKQANEIVATLADQGISAFTTKGRSSGANYAVEVDRDYYQLAVSVLNAKDLPRKPLPSVEELTRPQGFIPSSREVEALRLDYALGAEIEEKLRALAGVESAKVVIRSNLLKDDVQPSAGVFIAQSPGAKIDARQIAEIIALLVPGLQPDRIKVDTSEPLSPSVNLSEIGSENRAGVVIHRALVPFLWYFRVPEDDYRTLGAALLGCIVLGILLGGVFGFAIAVDRDPRDDDFGKLPATKYPSGSVPTIDHARADLTKPDRSQLRGPEV